jgi:hypothetical protein
MKNKKSQINQIFVYILSAMIIVFVGFLVTKFVLAFTSDAQDRVTFKIFDEIKTDYNDIYRTYGSEKVLDYKVPSNVNLICFVSKRECISSLNEISDEMKIDLNLTYGAGDNVVIFDGVGIKATDSLNSFETNEGCFCVKPNNGFFELLFENRRNVVYISEN